MSANFTNQFFARLQAARNQLLQLDWWSERLPPEQVVDLHDVVRVNDVLLLARKLVSRERSAAFVQLLSPDRPVTAGGVRLAVKLAHGTIKTFVQRYGHFDRDVQEWVLPGERTYVEKRAGEGFDDDFDWR